MDVIKSPIKAIRAKCLDCCCGQAIEVKLCTVTKCPLHPFRFGKNVFHSRAKASQATSSIENEWIIPGFGDLLDECEEILAEDNKSEKEGAYGPL